MNKSAAVALLLLGVVGFAAACTPNQPVDITPPHRVSIGPSVRASDRPSGVVGRVLMEGGPISPSASSTPRPWPNKAIRVTDARGTVVAKARTGTSGWFSAALDPGAYRIRTSDARPVSFVVRAGAVTRLTIEIPVP
jgi:hypothetical protein